MLLYMLQNKTISRLKLFVYLVLFVWLAVPGGVAQVTGKELEKLGGLQLERHPANDGDSFFATDGERRYYLRLYFIDSPESSASSSTLARRIREQTRYFGLSDHTTTVSMGKTAADYTKEELADTFTAYTAFANAGGRSAQQRIYAFVVTADGKDLGRLLVSEGLARAYGLGRQDYRGTSRQELKERFKDIEIEAMLKRKGVWEYADADQIVKLRAEQREEERTLQDIKERTAERVPGAGININTAGKDQLTLLPGIGPVLAERIIKHRPYEAIDELLQVKGIGEKTLKEILPLIRLNLDS